MTTTNRKLNFNAGPAALPPEVLQEAAEAVIAYKNSGLSVLELQHRGKEFRAIIEESQQLVKELCGLNDDYHVLWLHGGGRLQFCMVPMNFLWQEDSAGYIDSGHWSEEALEYAAHYGDVQVLSSSKSSNYTHLPEWPVSIPNTLSYVHYTTNNTIYGTQWHNTPNCNVPLIADMSSDIFCGARDYTRYAMFYAAAQKNIGPAGATLAVVHKEMLGGIKRELPPMLSYKAQVAEHSILNTSPVYAIYVSLLMLRWTKAKGITAIEKDNREKSRLLYTEIERNTLFTPVVKQVAHRSIMNVCFTAVNAEVENDFNQFCDANSISGLKGHRYVGGFRASIYNAVSVHDVQQLVALMGEYEDAYIKRNG